MNAERKDYFSASMNSTRAEDCGDNSHLASYGRSHAKYSTRAGDCGDNSRPASYDQRSHDNIQRELETATTIRALPRTTRIVTVNIHQ